MKYMFPRLNDIKILPLHLNTIRIQCRTQFTGCKSLIVFAPPPVPPPPLVGNKIVFQKNQNFSLIQVTDSLIGQCDLNIDSNVVKTNLNFSMFRLFEKYIQTTPSHSLHCTLSSLHCNLSSLHIISLSHPFTELTPPIPSQN